jgi:hypothetical protein
MTFDISHQSEQIRFAIVCLGRTGSSHLVSLLDSHPQIRCHGEVFGVPGAAPIPFGYTDPEKFLLEQVFAVDRKAVGMKLPWDAFFKFPQLFDLMRVYDFSVIRITRENLLDQYLSMRLAQQSGDWSSRGDGYGVHPFPVDPSQAEAKMMEFRLVNRLFKEATVSFPSTSVTYEEVAAGEGLDRIFTLLGVDPMPLKSELRKQRKGSQAEIVSNFEELRQAFHGTQWSEYLTS